jgi:hypothetical protein
MEKMGKILDIDIYTDVQFINSDVYYLLYIPVSV